jgi:hypothetical protein
MFPLRPGGRECIFDETIRATIERRILNIIDTDLARVLNAGIKFEGGPQAGAWDPFCCSEYDPQRPRRLNASS